MPMNFAKAVLGPGMKVFARPVTYTPPGGEPIAVRGVFDEAHEIIKTAGDGSEYSTTAPVLGIRLLDWATAPVQGGTLSIDGTIYRVFDLQPDGEGGVDVILKKQV